MLTFILETKEDDPLERDSIEIEKDMYFRGVNICLTNRYGDQCNVRFSLKEALEIASGLKKICEQPIKTDKE